VTEAPEERFAPDLEAAAYYVVSEALANAGKHASATRTQVSIGRSGGVLRVQVADDGVGGADPAGSGLTGLADLVMLDVSPRRRPRRAEVAGTANVCLLVVHGVRARAADRPPLTGFRRAGAPLPPRWRLRPCGARSRR
jgi:hypothetical protein